MNRMLWMFSFAMVAQQVWADTLSVKAKVNEVVVFFSGAQVVRTGVVKLPTGRTTLTISPLPAGVEASSVNIELRKGPVILSVKHERKELGITKKSQEERLIENRMNEEREQIVRKKEQNEVLILEENVLQENRDWGMDKKGMDVKVFQESMNFYRARLEEIRSRRATLQKAVELLEDTILKQSARLAELASERTTTFCRLIILIESKQTFTGEIKVSYYIKDAGWKPLYDFRVDEIDKPLRLTYNASVFQHSGEDWKDVQVRLSSGNPLVSGTKPEVEKWILGSERNQSSGMRESFGSVSGVVRDAETSEPIPFCSLQLMQNGKEMQRSASNLDGEYIFRPVPVGSYSIHADYTGYKGSTKSIQYVAKDKNERVDLSMSPRIMQLRSVEVVAYKDPILDPDTLSGATYTRESYSRMATKDVHSVAAQTAGVRMIGSGARNMQSTPFLVTRSHAEPTHVSYLIDMPFTIPSDGSDYLLRIKEVQVPVNYLYEAAPAIDADVFLTALIPDWEMLQLLSGEASIYYQETFTGKSSINDSYSKDTLVLSLGRDKRVSVKYEQESKRVERKGGLVSETVTQRMEIRNNQTSNVSMVIRDQVPVSPVKDVEVVPLKADGSRISEQDGIAVWNLALGGGERSVLELVYEIRYPKRYRQ